MTVRFDLELSPDQAGALAATDPRWWFTPFHFANAESPKHPKFQRLEMANRMKKEMVQAALERLVPEKKVLDVFCANGGFSFEAVRLGAADVLGLDYDETRIECGRFVGGLLQGRIPVIPRFQVADVYELHKTMTEKFDVTLALGGLYHVADPALVLRNLRAVTSGYLIVQTSRLLRMPGSWGRFMITSHSADRTQEGGAGVWALSVKALETMLTYARFEVVERLPVPRVRGRRIPWYGAVCRAV